MPAGRRCPALDQSPGVGTTSFEYGKKTMETAIRLADAEDAEQIRAIYEPIVLRTAISFELEAPTVEEIGRRISNTLLNRPWLVCDRAGEVLGYAYAGHHRERAAYQWSVDASVYIKPDFHRRGVGRALYRSLFELLALQRYYNAYAGIALPNPGSVGLHESVGFRPVGVYREVGYKLGSWHDVGWWFLQLQPKPPSPLPPIPLAEARTDSGWPAALAAGQRILRA
jgi:L-amino acid N-acyltransferase YncA